MPAQSGGAGLAGAETVFCLKLAAEQRMVCEAVAVGNGADKPVVGGVPNGPAASREPPFFNELGDPAVLLEQVVELSARDFQGPAERICPQVRGRQMLLNMLSRQAETTRLHRYVSRCDVLYGRLQRCGEQVGECLDYQGYFRNLQCFDVIFQGNNVFPEYLSLTAGDSFVVHGVEYAGNIREIIPAEVEGDTAGGVAMPAERKGKRSDLKVSG